MSRRVRFTPLLGAGVFAVLAAAPARAVDVPFAPPATVATIDTPAAVVFADVDGDGDTDALSAEFLGDAIGWHENLAGNGTSWAFRTIATVTASPAFRHLAPGDLDGDGDVDAVSAGVSGSIAWHRNDAGNGTAWTSQTVTTAASGATAVATADVDGDGDTDIVACFADGLITWHENVLGNGSAWTLRTVAQRGLFTASLAVSDLDRDGDLDVASAAVDGDTVAWHENVGGNGVVWTTHTLSTMANGALAVATADVDRDGDPDIVVALREGTRVAWYENAAGNGSTWIERTIATAFSAAESVFAMDMDVDGDVDVLSGWNAFSGPLGGLGVSWYENAAGNGRSWVTHTVATGADFFSVGATDVDGDGDPDLLYASSALDLVGWQRNQSIHETACFAQVNTIFSTDTPFGSAATDIDRDGDLDVFATTWTGNGLVTWHRNEGGGEAWTAFTVATGHNTFIVDAADIDGDGDSDALLGASVTDPASWAENLSAGSAWSIQAVATPSPALPPLELRAADIDGDGDLDALAPAFNTNFLSWYENQNGLGDSWSLHTVATAAPDRGTEPVDLDRDGDLDILTPATPLVWYENTAANGSAWTRRTISTTGALAVGVLDLDGDGDLDVIASMDTLSLPEILWHENVSGNGTSWAAHSLSTIGGDILNIHLRDLDGDGDLDVVASQGLASVNWLERTGPGVAFVLRTIATTANGVGTISAPDLDGDGDPDALWTSQVDDAVVWNRNGRGQVVLDLLDQVPSTVNNNDVFPILRLTVTHGGRAGDSDLELARLGLLFEEGPGDPLTSAEANALVEELRIYGDANGNGTFDPGIDTLVATVPTLALGAGIQTVAFADGDPNVQVAFGTPRSFFVVAQLTANASQQAPNQFRVTHLALGPSATLAEDRSADIPLAIACPADVATRIIGPVVPVELMRFTVE